MPEAATLERPGSGPKPSNFPSPGRWFSNQFALIRSRLLGGLLVAAPVVITCWIVYWIFITLARFLLDPLAMLAQSVHNTLRESSALQEAQIPDWWYRIASPILAILLVLCVLYFLGLMVRSWLYRTVDGLFLKAPIVATIYRAVRNLVDTLGERLQGKNDPRRVVLVAFPHAGIRSLGVVTNSIRDDATGHNILAVCVLTGVMPPTGFTLFVPESDVVELGWTVNDAVQTIMSGGILVPGSIPFSQPNSGAAAKVDTAPG